MKRILVLAVLLLNATMLFAQSNSAQTDSAVESKLANVRALNTQANLHLQSGGSASSAWQQESQAEFKSGAISAVQALLLALAALMLIVFALRKFYKVSPLTNTKRLKVKERLSITNKTALILVELDGRSMLVSVGPDRVSFCDRDQGLIFNEADLANEVGMLCPEKVPA